MNRTMKKLVLLCGTALIVLSAAASMAAGAESLLRTASFDGVEVSYMDEGEKDALPVVFIHGWACTGNFWRFQTSALRDRYRVIALDLPGFGKSGKPQKIQVKILKHRNGSKGDALLDFYPMFNYFTDKVTANSETGSGWSKTEGGYSSSMRPKKSKRETEREALAKAFYEVQRDDFTADLTALADALDKSKKQVQNLIAEYGGYTVAGEVVSLAHEEEDSRGFIELGEQEEIPF